MFHREVREEIILVEYREHFSYDVNIWESTCIIGILVSACCPCKLQLEDEPILSYFLKRK